MKINNRTSLILFAAAFATPNLHRAFADYGANRYAMFLFSDEVISVQWYVKMLCSNISFLFTMLLVCSILKPVAKHIKSAVWVGHNAMGYFVEMWQQVFALVSVTAVIDILHFVLAFQRVEWIFLLQNLLFLVLSSYKIFYTLKGK